MPDIRKNLQVRQPGIEGYDVDDKNGWPNPLVDPSSPLKISVVNGTNGSQRNFDPTSTSQQDNRHHHLPEGRNSSSGGGDTPQGVHSNKLHTSQQNDENHSTPESKRSQ